MMENVMVELWKYEIFQHVRINDSERLFSEEKKASDVILSPQHTLNF